MNGGKQELARRKSELKVQNGGAGLKSDVSSKNPIKTKLRDVKNKKQKKTII